MLVLSRKVGDSIRIGDNIEIVVNRISGNRVTIGVEAPKDVRILRGEVELDLEADNAQDVVLALNGLMSAAQADYSHSTT